MRWKTGNHAAAVRHLESIPNIDSNAEGLACLLRARLAMSQPEEAEPLARKLLVVHDDLSGIDHFADWLATRGQFEAALRIYAEHSDRLLANNPERLLNALRTLTDRVKENATALELVLGLLQKAGEQSQITEVIELLAHALVQRGDQARARDYYRDLSVLEPENPVHEQNYRQMVARLGQDSVARSFSAQEGGRAFMADELETSAPGLTQPLDAHASGAVEAALTESELLDSYNLHPKAIATLESVLAQAPKSARLHQRLATAYAHSERYEDAARSCDILAEVFEENGHAAQAREYTALAKRYREQAAERSQAESSTKLEAASELPPDESLAQAAPPAEEFALDSPSQEVGSAESISAADDSIGVEAGPEFKLEFQPDPSPGREVRPEVREDAGDTVEAVGSLQEAVGSPQSDEFQSSPSAGDASAESPDEAEVELDISDEWQPAMQATTTEELLSGLQTGEESADEVVVEPDEPANSPAAELLEEIRFYIGQQMWEEAAAVIEKCAALAPQLPDLPELKQQIAGAIASAQASPAEVSDSPFSGHLQPGNAFPQVPPPEAGLAEVSRSGVPANGIAYTSEPASAQTVPADYSALPPLGMPPAAQPTAHSGSALDNLVAGLEAAMPSDLAPATPPPACEEEKPAAAPPSVEAWNGSRVNHAETQDLVEELDLPDAAPELNGAVKDAPKDALAELFEEFKQEAEQTGSDNEDPESHYSLGVAFREMGLLDEAIGELQKVARTIEMRHSFRDTLQVYTLLGQCFLEKGVPEVAVRWYEKALSSASDGEARVAVHYELGSAHEAAGSRPAALKHFMEVYGANIDYRDVAERIRGLKS